MNSLPTVYDSPVGPSTNAAAALAAHTAANDDPATATVDSTRNPLWIMAIAMASFFGAVAAVISLT